MPALAPPPVSAEAKDRREGGRCVRCESLQRAGRSPAEPACGAKRPASSVSPRSDDSTTSGASSRRIFNTARYGNIEENPFLAAASNPLSTFSIDVDTASYSNIRRFIENGSLPPKDAVRIEEMINYFSYDYPQPNDNLPFSVNLDAASCPGQPAHRLVRIGLKGREMPNEKRPASNLVFLLDVSGSMDAGRTGCRWSSRRCVCSSRNWVRTIASRSWFTPALRAWRCRPRPAITRSKF